MFDVLRGKIDAKKDILSKDSATGLALSPYANDMLDKIRKKREKLTNLAQSKKNQARPVCLICLETLMRFRMQNFSWRVRMKSMTSAKSRCLKKNFWAFMSRAIPCQR